MSRGDDRQPTPRSRSCGKAAGSPLKEEEAVFKAKDKEVEVQGRSSEQMKAYMSIGQAWADADLPKKSRATP